MSRRTSFKAPRDDSLSPEGSECSTSTTQSHADRKKETHLRCERQRREAINNGYTELKALLPASMSTMGCKTTNASILFKASEYIKQLQSEADQEEKELQQAESKEAALKMIAGEYENMSRESPQESNIQSQMMKKLLDDCYDSFKHNVNPSDYGSMAKSLISWVEQLEPESKKSVNEIIRMPFNAM
ncbi:unnamed protein product, partial [Mesorhabditis spiculigera]